MPEGEIGAAKQNPEQYIAETMKTYQYATPQNYTGDEVVLYEKNIHNVNVRCGGELRIVSCNIGRLNIYDSGPGKVYIHNSRIYELEIGMVSECNIYDSRISYCYLKKYECGRLEIKVYGDTLLDMIDDGIAIGGNGIMMPPPVGVQFHIWVPGREIGSNQSTIIQVEIPADASRSGYEWIQASHGIVRNIFTRCWKPVHDGTSTDYACDPRDAQNYRVGETVAPVLGYLTPHAAIAVMWY